MSEKPRRRWIMLLALALSLAITTGSMIFVAGRLSTPAASDLDGITTFDPPRRLADFTLLSHRGEPLSLSDLRGRQVLMLFGYTHCPDVCPLTMATFARIHQHLGEQAANLAFVFISVDGERDTPQHLADYLQQRQVSEFVIGMTGDERSLRRLGRDYDLFFQKQSESASDEDYLVDHTASLYLIDEAGQLIATFAFGTDAVVIGDYIAG